MYLTESTKEKVENWRARNLIVGLPVTDLAPWLLDQCSAYHIMSVEGEVLGYCLVTGPGADSRNA